MAPEHLRTIRAPKRIETMAGINDDDKKNLRTIRAPKRIENSTMEYQGTWSSSADHPRSEAD